MLSSLRSILLGPQRSGYRRYLVVGLAFGTFVVSITAYALGLFTVSGGVIWIPFYAAIVGMLAGCCVGYVGDGLVSAWVVTFTAFLGYHADHAFFGLTRRPFTEQLAYFVRWDGLVFLAVEAIVIGSLAFVLGALLRRSLNRSREQWPPRVPIWGND